MTYNIVLVAAVQQSDQLYVYTYLFFFRLLFHVGYYRILSRVPYAIQ